MIATVSEDETAKLIDIGTGKTIFSSFQAKTGKQKGDFNIPDVAC